MVTLPFLTRPVRAEAGDVHLLVDPGLSVLTESLARSWPHWLVGKLLAGVGVGCMQHTLPTYISEVAPVKIRGGLLMCYSLWWTIGTFFAYIGIQNMNSQHPNNYLTPIYTQFAQIGLMLLIYVFLPESPAWCVSRGNEARAKKELLKINYGVRDFNLEQQFQIVALNVEHERAVAVEQRREHWHSIFRGVDGRRTIVALWTNLSQQFIGLTLFGTYGTYFFQQAGIDDPFKIKCITSSINIATSIIIVLVADRLGRRWIACSATTLSWVACVAIGILGVSPQVHATQIIFVLFVCFWSK